MGFQIRGMREHSGKRGGDEKRVGGSQRSGRSHAAEIRVQVFKFHRPVAGVSVLRAAADGAADTGL